MNREKGRFKSDLLKGRKIKVLTFDIMIFSGDVIFNLVEDINYHKYYFSNKIHIAINFEELLLDEIVIDFSAELNSFFTIKYNVNYFNLEQMEEYISSGENYLVHINGTSSSFSKDIYLSNIKYKNKNPFLTTFFSLNCEFEVKRQGYIINFFNGYAQEIIQPNEVGYNSYNYKYSIKITNSYLSNDNNKMCMLYISGYEAENDNSREIIIPENINQQIIFEKNLKKIRFLFPSTNPFKDLLIYFNVIDKSYYDINIFIDKQNIQSVTITNTEVFYIRSSIITSQCRENSLCPIVIQIEYIKEILKIEPMIEITVRYTKNSPSYLQKNKIKNDFVCGDLIYYLYTDLGKNDNCEISVNFLRDSGEIYGKVVRKDQRAPHEESNWKGIYRFPSYEWEDSLPFNSYTKKMIVSPKDTEHCIEGCYLLISIRTSQIGEYIDDSKISQFTILARITNNNELETDIPNIIIQTEEIILGNINITENKIVHDFYEIWLPHDSERIEFDFQSSGAGLYINLGNEKPTKTKADFILFPYGKNSILELTKTEILLMAISKGIKIPYQNSLQDINLIIHVLSDNTDSKNTELYSLRIHQPMNNLDIIEINTDHKILCKPTDMNNGHYRCLFMLTYRDEDSILYTPLIIHSSSINRGSINYIYVNFIDKVLYTQYQTDLLNQFIPTENNNNFNNEINGVDYIYIKNLQKNQYPFISVISDKPDDIMIITSMPLFNYLSFDIFEFTPNSYGEQLLFFQNDELRLSFPVSDNIMVDITALEGQANIFWKNSPDKTFNLKGNGDKISLSNGKIKDNLIIKRIETNDYSSENPGLVFYINYHLRNLDINFDEIKFGTSLELNYKDTDLPIVLYSKKDNINTDINIAVTFKDNNIEESGEYSSAPLIILAQLVKESDIYSSKKNPDLVPPIEKSILGHYNPALKTGQVFLSEDIIRNYNIMDKDIPTIYLKIQRKNNIKDKLYENFSIEAEISGTNDGIIPAENVYHYGKIRSTE